MLENRDAGLSLEVSNIRNVILEEENYFEHIHIDFRFRELGGQLELFFQVWDKIWFRYTQKKVVFPIVS